jgi:hypothetical protein
MNILKISILFSFIVININLAMSATQDKIFLAKDNLPIEISYLIDSIQNSHKTKVEKVKFKSSIMKLDQLFSNLSKEEIFFIIKSESYKSILKIKPDYQVKKTYYERDSLKGFEKYFKSKTISTFSKWVVKAIHSDILNIFNSSDFTTYMFRKKNNSVLTRNYIIVDKKLKSLLPWIGYINLNQPNEFEEDMKKHMIRLMEKLIIYSEQYLSLSKFNKLELTPIKEKLTFFTWEVPVPVATENSKTMKLEDVLLDPDEFLVDEDAPPMGWKPKDDTMEVKLIATPIPTPDPNYVAPKKLPEPISDWIDSI